MISRKLYEHKMAQVEGAKIYDGRNKGIDGKVERGNLGFKLQFNKHLL